MSLLLLFGGAGVVAPPVLLSARPAPLRRFTTGGLGGSPEARALKRIENLLGRTPTFGAHRMVTAATTIVDSDDLILGDTTAGSIIVTLPAAVANMGRRFTVKKLVATNTMTLAGNGSELIDGAATVALTTQYASRTVQSDGVGWMVVNSV